MAGIKDHKQYIPEGFPTQEMKNTETVNSVVDNFSGTPNVTAPRTQVVSQNYTPNQTGWALFPDGSAQFESILVKNTFTTVPRGGDIQRAIDIISASGGGTIQLSSGTYYLNTDIVGASNVSIKGAGAGSTILDFQSGVYGIKYAGNTTTSYVENFAITDLTVKDADLTGDQEIGTRSGGIHIKYAKFFEIRNVNVTSCADDGVLIEMGEDFNVSNCNFDNNGVNGFEVLGNSTYFSKRFTVQNCFADTNGKDGFQVTYNVVKWGSFLNCHAESNTQNGFYMYWPEAVALVGCSATSNGLHGFSHANGSCNVLGCVAELNTTDGFYLSGGSSTATGCQGRYSGNLNFNVDWSAEGQRVAFAGNVFDRLADSEPNNGAHVYDSPVLAQANAAQGLVSKQSVLNSVNLTGSTITAGSVVSWKATARGDEIETTTIQGDPNVIGMAMFDIENNQSSEVLTEGKTTILKVNGEEDIAIGDWLQTSTVAGVAMRASTAGQTVFAKALTAYATGATGTMTAILVSPRSI